MANSDKRRSGSSLSGLQLRKLTIEQVEQIDRYLASVGEYGEVRLIVQHGELKYINKLESYKASEDDDEG